MLDFTSCPSVLRSRYFYSRLNEPLHSSVPGDYSLVSSPSDRFQELYFLIIKHLFSNYLIVGHYAGYSSKAFLSSICCYGLSSYEQGLECLVEEYLHFLKVCLP